MADFFVALAVGAVGGWMAGLLGVGGGFIFVPAMVLLLDRPQHEAQGVSLSVIVITALAATITHSRRGNVDTQIARWVVPGATIAGFVAAAVATQLPEEALRRIFAVVLVLLAVRMIWQAWRPPHGSDEHGQARTEPVA